MCITILTIRQKEGLFIMNPLEFTNAVISTTSPLQGLRDVTGKTNRLHDMQVEDTELRLLIADLYQHLGVAPRQNARQDAQQILAHMNQEQAYQLAQVKFMERQYAYMNGSVLERFRRFIGGHPLPPMNPNAMPVGFQQPQQMPNPMMGMQGMPGMNMYPPQQPMYQQPMYQPMPQGNAEVDALRNDLSKLTGIVEHLVQNMTKGV
jgi:hypothetical protein